METIVNVAFPVFAIVALGYLAGHWRILGPESAVALNRFVYYFALPPVLFVFTARAPIDEVLNWPFIAAFLLGTLATLAISFVIGRLVHGHNLSLLTMQGFTAVFANTAYMGIPLFLPAYGEEGALPAIVATFAGLVVLIGGVVATLESVRAKGPSPLDICREVAGAILRNPLLIAPLLGIGYSALALPLPTPIGNFLDLMAASAGPAALFALGLSLVGRPLLGDLAEVSWLIVLKLAVHPLLTFLLVKYVFELDPLWANAAIVLSALPVGALVFVVAQQYDLYVQRASAAIVLSTTISVVTISVLLIALGIH